MFSVSFISRFLWVLALLSGGVAIAPQQPQPHRPAESSSSKPYFIKQGDKYLVTSREALDLLEELPVATYTIGMNMDGSFHLQKIDSFNIEGKIYGDTKQQANRILSTFLDRQGSTGVLMAGEKGSGKTFLAKYVSIEAAKKGIPTIVVNQPLSGEGFNKFLQSIQQPTVLLLDEFEKIYGNPGISNNGRRRHYEDDADGVSSPHQNNILTLLDGVYASNMLFMLTSNDKYSVASQMRNRPGRIYYVFDFHGLPTDFIKEYCEDNLKNSSRILEVVAASSLFDAFTFDMLKAMVEEMNRYDESAHQVLRYLNVRPEFSGMRKYTVESLVVAGSEVNKTMIEQRSWYGNPSRDTFHCHYLLPPPVAGPKPSEWRMDPEEYEKMIEFSPSHLERMDGQAGTLVYFHEKENARVTLKRKASSGPESLDLVKLTTSVTAPPPTTHGAGGEAKSDGNNIAMKKKRKISTGVMHVMQ